jgi:integrase
MANQKAIPAILRNLDKVNYKKAIKLRYRALAKHGFSLYLDASHNNKREYQFLKIYILGKKETKAQDKENLQLAIAIRDKKELELIQNKTGFQLDSWKSAANFVEYFKSIADSRPPLERAWRNTYAHLRNFTGGKIQFKNIDERFCESFKDYILEKVAVNTAAVNVAVFKAGLNRALKEKIIPSNPAQHINIKRVDVDREFLTIEEIQKLKSTPCKDEQLKNAFLFACFTGLRISDIEALTFDNIKSGYLKFKQKKTNGIDRMKLHPEAIRIVDDQRTFSNSNDGRIFNLKSNQFVNKHLRRWVRDSGISKKITFHSARHTFATLCLTYDVDLFTVSKLLGHRDIKATQIYAKLIDKKKDEAIDKLPELS